MSKKKIWTDEEQFWEGIRENLDDMGPRLVFADWLDENNNPDLATVLRWTAWFGRTPRKNSNGYSWEYSARIEDLKNAHKNFLPWGFWAYTGSVGNTKIDRAFTRLIRPIKLLTSFLIVPVSLLQLYDKTVKTVEEALPQSLEGGQQANRGEGSGSPLSPLVDPEHS